MSTGHPQPSAEIATALERLRRDGDRLFGSRRIHVVPLSVQVRESSEVVRAHVTTPTGSRYVYAKRMGPRRRDEPLDDVRARLVRDFTITTQVFDAMKATPDLRAVEPLACYEDLLCSVTREAPGTPLDALTSRTATWSVRGPELERLRSIYTTAGRWIARFQEVAIAGEPAPVSLDAARDYLQARLDRLVAMPRARFTAADRAALLAHFDRLASAVPSAELADTAVHGDITPSNIIVAPDHVTVIDFAMAARGSRYFDVARLYTQLEFYTAKPQYWRRVISGLQRALLAGFDTRLHDTNPQFEIYAIQHVVCHFVSHARQPGRFPVSLYSLHQCRLHHRWLQARVRLGQRTRGPLRVAVEPTV